MRISTCCRILARTRPPERIRSGRRERHETVFSMRRRSGGRGTDAGTGDARRSTRCGHVASSPTGPASDADRCRIGMRSPPQHSRSASSTSSSMPMLPNLSGPRAGIGQAVAGLPGARCDNGRILTDAERFGTRAPIRADLDHVSFAGLRAFLGLAGKIRLDGVRRHLALRRADHARRRTQRGRSRRLGGIRARAADRPDATRRDRGPRSPTRCPDPRSW